MSAAERRWWMENTPGGMLARALGRDPFAVDHAQVEAVVEGTKDHYRAVYGRELSPGEIAGVRFGAELRSAPVTQHRQLPTETSELVRMVNNTTVSAGWSYTPTFRGQHSGMAIRNTDGTWSGDPAVVASAQAAEAEKAARGAAAEDAYRNGPLVVRTIARPS